MVFLGENGWAVRFWPLCASARHAEKETATAPVLADGERAFAIADSLEKGLARELLTNFTRRLPRARKLWRFRVDRSDDRQEYRLSCDGEELLTFARVSRSARRVEFFMYDPRDEQSGLYDASKPVFTLSCNPARSEWRLVQERDDNCSFLSRDAPRGGWGRQEIAQVTHSRQRVGTRTCRCMEARISPLAHAPDAAAAPAATEERQRLTTKWSDGGALGFKDRQVLASKTNFQLVLPERPEHVVCQYGKIGPGSFGLDCAYPLTLIQAFGIAMTAAAAWE
mmetsp:Transcript_59538/g.167739  ORF Transcript_59538/g.167739 Transcript_59538/m.167739 type:complete len:281 (+) Transcript_59538:75-917(+)